MMNRKGKSTINGDSDVYNDNIEETIAVNDMYIDAIQAKLKILD